MEMDLPRARRDTPGVAHVTHLNNAGASLMPACVVEAQIAHIRAEARIGGYEAKAAAQEQFERTYGAVAELLNCGPDEVALTENATVAWQQAVHALPWQAGDTILTGEAEYGSNYIDFLHLKRRLGVEVRPVPSDADGQLDVAALDGMIDDRTRLIAVTHVPTNGGLVNPAEAIGAVARKHGVTYLLDACQSAGQLDLDVERIGCDLLSATGRKYLRAPRGTGFLYVRRALLDRLDPVVLDNHAAEWTGPDSYAVRPDARRFENWEFNVAAAIGLGVAVDYALSWGLTAIQERVAWLAQTLRRRLARIPGVQVHDLGTRQCGIVTFTVDGLSPAAVQAALGERRINVSVSERASSLLDMDRRGLAALVRASVHYFNSEEEIELCVGAVAGLAREAA